MRLPRHLHVPSLQDYHVIFMYQPDERCLVFDLDSDLPFPTYFHKYVTETLRTDHILHPEHHRWFRVLPALVYLQKFASDRRHMRHADGSWLQPPPPHPAIRAQATRNKGANCKTIVPTARQ
ncbi:hypothetical protein HAZT_HAZT006362 [Hyalella azteca]|uniref:Protein N-terminal glutamine amidohydrolase n=1 Tax=Hyalella azteca TaxID=294128 RepID=A0A6A0H0G8_HYAAZ|nr:hypothetical protein HAZT_HAZT006362 [Hyalella azteca]